MYYDRIGFLIDYKQMLADGFPYAKANVMYMILEILLP